MTMNILRIFIPTVLLLVFFGGNAAAKGYRITLLTDKADTTEYTLHGWKWGDRVPVDTVKAAKGKIVFSSRKDLLCGSYAISELSGRKLVEFVVPRKNSNFRITFEPVGKGYNIKQGDGENCIFSDFQYLVNYGWEKLSSADDFTAKLNELRKKAAGEFPGSITDIIISNALYSPKSSDELRSKFPFSDTVILNTPFAEDKVEQYLRMLQYNHNDTIAKYVDSLIACGGNRELQNRLAYTAYNFFYDPKIMGQEGIAVHIAQNWFLNDKLNWPNKEGKFMLRTFVEFNKHSLIGMDAPELALKDTSGNTVTLSSLDAEYTILYFYTDDCATCLKETPMLVDFVNGYEDGMLAVYAVYANDNAQRWKEYIDKELFIYNPFMNWVNVYDPEYESGFQMLYNVIKTPQMFLLDKEKKIVGRGLNVKALKELLAERNTQRDRTRDLIEEFFAPLAGDTLQIFNGIDMFYNSSKGDTTLLKEFMYEIYGTLGRSENYNLQKGSVYLAEKYIIGMPELWKEEYVEGRREEARIFNMNRLGEPATDLELERADGSPINLSDITSEYKVLYFYRPNCGICTEVTPKMAVLDKKFKNLIDLETVAVNLGGSYTEWIEYISGIDTAWENVRGTEGNSAQIYRDYYLESVPTIYLLKDNIVIAKDINEIELEKILNTITL